VAEASVLEVLVHFGRGKAGQQLLAQSVVFDDALALAVMLVHAHRLEADGAGKHFMRDVGVGHPTAVKLVVRVSGRLPGRRVP
jgi:hypothetical protein